MKKDHFLHFQRVQVNFSHLNQPWLHLLLCFYKQQNVKEANGYSEVQIT